MLAGNREFVATHPVATKRVMRAILPATDLCATEPARAAQQLADRGRTPHYDYAFQTVTMARIRRRGYDPVLCFAPARRRPYQVNSAKDHCRGHRLALSERAQTRAEGVNTECQRG